MRKRAAACCAVLRAARGAAPATAPLAPTAEAVRAFTQRLILDLGRD
ncbi:MAG: hypothetical protein ACHQM4_05565 [Thermoanaerobaculia bacterium]